jgi:hypothetical protein
MARAAVNISTLYQLIRDDLDKIDKAADFSFGIWRHDPDDIGANWNAAIRRIRGDASDTKWQEVGLSATRGPQRRAAAFSRAARSQHQRGQPATRPGPGLQRAWQRLQPGTTDYDGRAVKASCSAHLIHELECGRGKRLSSKRRVSGANESGCFDGTPTDARGLRALELRLRMRILELGLLAIAASGLIGATAVSAPMSEAQVGKLLPAKMPRIGAIDERYQSFNVEMLEVTGGDFWRPTRRSIREARQSRIQVAPARACQQA